MNIATIWLLVSGLLSVCFAQSINVTGIVKESSGAGVANASVRLKGVGITTETGLDGNFTLSNSVAGKIDYGYAVSQPAGWRQFEIHRNVLHVLCTEPSLTVVKIFNTKGRQVLSSSHTLTAGKHAISMPELSDGLHIIKIAMNGEQYVLRSGIGYVTEGAVSLSRKRKDEMNAANVTDITDTVVVSKAGFDSKSIPISKYIVDLGTITLTESAGPIVARDFEGNEYPAIRFGNQVWTTVNFRCTKLNDGTPIALVTGDDAWKAVTTPAYCFFRNTTDTAYQRKYGALYNPKALLTGKLAPPGWRVAGHDDWTELERYLIANGYNWDGTTTGNKIAKSLASAGGEWIAYGTAGSVGNNQSGNNRTGFTGLPGGCRGSDAGWHHHDYNAYWWSLAEGDTHEMTMRGLDHRFAYLNTGEHPEQDGLPVRLVRN